ncbi:MAG: 5-formyltetrahydrofolate cyclo-ligase [Sandaracinaceae bacterium]|nr:5-formyltetrahydrofolate cyclo-ligase [Sandaracinaceae bacterium]
MDPAELDVRVQVKAEIRKRRLQVRRAIPREAREARSRAITERVLALPEWRAARTIAAFVSMRTEVQTGGLVEEAWARAARVGALRMTFERDDLELAEWRKDTALEESGNLFVQPPRSAPSIALEEVDLVLVPALAVDPRGYRIGYGKGFYDRWLPRMTRALRVALVFDFEMIAEVPEHEGDVPVDVVATDERLVRTERA